MKPVAPSIAPTPARASRRALRSWWVLVALAVVAAGSLSSALAAPTGSWTGVRVAGSGLVLVLTVGLAARVMAAMDRARRRVDGHQGDEPLG